MIVVFAVVEVRTSPFPNRRMNCDIVGHSGPRQIGPEPADSCSCCRRRCHCGLCRSRHYIVAWIVQVVIEGHSSRRDRGRTPSRPVQTSAARRRCRGGVRERGEISGGVSCAPSSAQSREMCRWWTGEEGSSTEVPASPHVRDAGKSEQAAQALHQHAWHRRKTARGSWITSGLCRLTTTALSSASRPRLKSSVRDGESESTRVGQLKSILPANIDTRSCSWPILHAQRVHALVHATGLHGRRMANGRLDGHHLHRYSNQFERSCSKGQHCHMQLIDDVSLSPWRGTSDYSRGYVQVLLDRQLHQLPSFNFNRILPSQVFHACCTSRPDCLHLVSPVKAASPS